MIRKQLTATALCCYRSHLSPVGLDTGKKGVPCSRERAVDMNEDARAGGYYRAATTAGSQPWSLDNARDAVNLGERSFAALPLLSLLLSLLMDEALLLLLLPPLCEALLLLLLTAAAAATAV